MFHRRNFSSELATKCRFCGCPVVDDCVSLSTVDAVKLSNWSVARTGVPIEEESAGASWSCMNCVRKAKRFCETRPLEEDCIWWDEIKDRYFHYYQRGWMKSCSVSVCRLPENEIGRPLDCLQKIVIKHDIKEEEEEVEIMEQERVEKVEIVGSRMEVVHNDSNPSSRQATRKKKKKRYRSATKKTDQQKACRHCNISMTKVLPKNHIQTKSCPFCRKRFPCSGLLKCHRVDCLKKCPQCPKRYAFFAKLDKHLNEMHKIKQASWKHGRLEHWKHLCNLCNEVFPLDLKLLKHKKTCRGFYICDTCGAKFVAEYPFLRHLQQNHIFPFDVIKSCRKCDRVFFCKKSLTNHKKFSKCSRSQAVVLVACKYCKNKFVDVALKRHIPLCRNAKRTTNNEAQEQRTAASNLFLLICQICWIQCSTVGNMFKHLSTHREEALPLHCEHCKLNIMGQDMKRAHYCPSRPKVACSKCNLVMYEECLIHHQIIYKCCKCNLSFPCESLFQQHLTERTYPCLVCGKEFCDIPSLTGHVQTEHGKDKEVSVSWSGLEFSHLPYKCDKCKIYFETLNVLDKHKEMYHKEHHCDMCAKMFASKITLIRHVLHYHIPEIYFKSKGLLDKMAELEIGGEKVKVFNSHTDFETAATLNSRTQSYSKKSTWCPRANPASSLKSPGPFPCKKCDKTFDSKTDLLRHFSTTHDLFCRKFVGRGGSQISHMQSILMSKCQDCGKFFSTKENLQKHLDTYQGEDCSLNTPGSSLENADNNVLRDKHVLISPYSQARSEESRRILRPRVRDNAPSTSIAAVEPSGQLQPVEQIFIEEAPETKDHIVKPTEMMIFTLNVKKDDFVYDLKKGTTSSGEEFSWICGTCSLLFPSKGELEEHVLSSHTKFKMFCSLCLAELSNNAAYKLHMDTNHKGVQLPGLLGRALNEKCDLCVANFEKNVDDQYHRPISHLMRMQEDLVTCLICEKTFNNDRLGKEHVKVEHVLDNCVACAALMLGKYLEIHFTCCHSSPG